MIGCDVLEFDRIPKDEKFLTKILTENEKSYVEKFQQKHERIAGVFCAKEAVFKALNFDKICHKEIEIEHTESGRPFVVFHGETKLFFEKNYKHIDISISHSKTVAMAVCEIK